MYTPETHTKQLPPGQEFFGAIEYVRTQYAAKIPDGVTFEDILNPTYWAHHARDIRPTDEIRAVAEDRTWIAYLIVVDCARTWVKVQALSHHSLIQSQASADDLKAFMDGYDLKFRGPLKWSVIRKADGSVLQEGIENKDTATAWLDKFAREQTGVAKAA